MKKSIHGNSKKCPEKKVKLRNSKQQARRIQNREEPGWKANHLMIERNV
ncbi:hypothetical protein SLEP1_g13258 [Rubroshorea leprosula]|uniref:Uncharacterized protein n=1 Tax=Rubroshorea leprosula TaxID=152421 RepID=A0AAV5IF88_9ROSI|nr:hypothetical protein SLEP1_g13258 [Rubroshorea leprosula]